MNKYMPSSVARGSFHRVQELYVSSTTRPHTHTDWCHIFGSFNFKQHFIYLWLHFFRNCSGLYLSLLSHCLSSSFVRSSSSDNSSQIRLYNINELYSWQYNILYAIRLSSSAEPCIFGWNERHNQTNTKCYLREAKSKKKN